MTRPIRRSATRRPTRNNGNGREVKELGAKPVGSIKKARNHAFYGRAGTGKTTLAATWPKPILYLDIRDEGTDSIADIEGVDVKEITSFEEVEDVYWWLIQNPTKYKTVVWDTVTMLQQIIVEEISSSKNLKGKAAGDWGTMTKQDWGTVASGMKTWITNFRDLPMEVIFLAQDRVFNAGEDDDAEGILDPEVGPRLSPSVMSHLCAAVDVIGNTFVRERIIKKKVDGRTKTTRRIEYCLRLGPTSTYITKIRKPKSVELPTFLVDATYEDIIDVIKGEN